jgi:eukaryotic-like serine/threonine-protein kinase
MSDEWPIAGVLLAGRYRLAALLETGGMAQIWRADDELLARPVAVKLPTGPFSAAPLDAWREARMAARLSHPRIAAVHDYREAVRADGSVAPFVVMELLAGETVAARLARAPFGWPEAARVGAGVADALAAAHASGVVHRDIKPGNVMLTPNGVKILDFGISAAAGEPDDDETGATFGTPAYAAPERLDGHPAEPATDVYGLGVLLFEMVTGDPPFPVETWEELTAARATGPGELPSGLPDAFRAVVTRCLAEEPAARPPAAELSLDLTALAARTTSEPQSPATSDTAQPDTGTSDTGTPDTARPDTVRPYTARPYTAGRAPAVTLRLKPPTRRRLAVSLTALALAVAAGAALILLDRPGRHTSRAEPPAPPVTTSVPAAPPASAPATKRPAKIRSTAAVQPGPKREPQPQPQPKSKPKSKSSPGPKPSPTPTLTYTGAVTRLRTAVQTGVDAGQIRADVGVDLMNLVQSLSDPGTAGVGDQVDGLRRKIQDRVREGGVTPARAAVLDSRLSDVDRAAGA